MGWYVCALEGVRPSTHLGQEGTDAPSYLRRMSLDFVRVCAYAVDQKDTRWPIAG